MFDGRYAPVLAFLFTVVGLYAILATGFAKQVAQDNPNHRSLHTRPVPRIGGFIMMPAILAAWLLLRTTSPLTLAALGAGVLCLLSYVDDRFGLPIIVRFGSHLAAAIVFVTSLPPVFAVPAVLVIVWITNLYNFMDGTNGLAGGMALIGFSSFAIAAANSAPDLALASACVAAAAAAFLIFNFNPAQIFLGDAGSIPLGFLVAALGIIGWRATVWDLWFPLLVFSPFIVDASVTLLRRFLRRERFWEAHRDHYYQRIVRMGWSHRRLALAEYALMSLAGATALTMRDAGPSVQAIGLFAWMAIFAMLTFVVDCRWALHGDQA